MGGGDWIEQRQMEQKQQLHKSHYYSAYKIRNPKTGLVKNCISRANYSGSFWIGIVSTVPTDDCGNCPFHEENLSE